MVAALVVAAATVSLGFARYAGHFFDAGVRPAALGLLAGLAVLATTGIKQSVRVTVVLSAVQVGGLVIVIVIGAPHVGDVSLLAGLGLGSVLGMLTQLEARAVWMGLAVCAAGAIAAFLLRSGGKS